MRDRTPSLVDASSLLSILEVSRRLAVQHELDDVLELILHTGREVLGAERGTVFLYDTARRELYARVATGGTAIRFPADRGIAGECVRSRKTVVVNDCYADPRFNPEVDRQTGFRTRCLIAVPLVGIDQELVGVLQMLNTSGDQFTWDDQTVAELLAAQAAVAIQRTLLLEERLIKLKLQHDMAIARDIQQNVLVRRLPPCPGYTLSAYNQPADATGGDIYDIIPLDQHAEASPLLLLVADATGHGIGPALNITQLRAMLRLGLRLSADLPLLLNHINQQLVQDLPGDRFITAFLGVLDPIQHQVRFHAAGQGPVLHYRATTGEIVWRETSTTPLGMFPEIDVEPPPPIHMDPGDLLVLLTDGFYEYQNAAGEELGPERVGELIARIHENPVDQILATLLSMLREFAGSSRQNDDLTALLVKREV
ncbi:PP2C family protein-serine/threonine phosphatase [Chondromyces crocatus]|uniref:Protein phosphatase n=1 Tax=Chondromyces crocatus TaxID=52 RepID=A0A0K1ERS0_CHOCO|nr:GAF domain-containing SpoIIE family protein phosphatase [Chondromyces crocatus]AKT43541.1 protein phosphatase [Chondromyces crocatus]